MRSTMMVAEMPRKVTAVTKIKKPAHHTHTGTSGRYWWSAMAAMMYMRSGVTRYWSSMSQPVTKPMPLPMPPVV